MAKTKPIGVRFDLELWQKLEVMGIMTAQSKLNFLEKWYIDNLEKVICYNNIPETKNRIEHERINTVPHSIYPAEEKIVFKSQIRHSYDWYAQARKDCETVEQWNELKEMILSDEFLTEKQKFTLTQKPVS